MENRIDVVLTKETEDQILKSVSDLKKMMPFLIKLSAADRDTMPMISDGRKPFVEKAYDLASRSAIINPGADMVTAGLHDLNLFSFLMSLENELLQLLEMVRDTKQLAGGETYEVARYVYSKAKMELKMGTPGMQAIVDELGKLYKQSPAAAKVPVK